MTTRTKAANGRHAPADELDRDEIRRALAALEWDFPDRWTISEEAKGGNHHGQS